METILTITIPLILTGIAFVTYNHPRLAREILKILLYTSLILFALSVTYYIGRIKAISDIQIPFIQDKESIEEALKSENSFNDKLFNSIYIYFGLTLVALLIFYFLSRLFDNVRNPVSKEQDKSTEQTTSNK